MNQQYLTQNPSSLTHLDQTGAACMVDVSDKAVTKRIAVASAMLITRPDVIELINSASLKKGDVLATARIAGIMAAKKTADLIPLCHPLALAKVSIDFDCNLALGSIAIRARCITNGQTGVEMEALTAASVAALTIYDMCKAVDKHMEINSIYVEQKSGGKTGDWQKESEHD
ncbi:cyclic pyranopterin monophosphate synthase MoaC [Cellvibrio sp. OA-2007]|uniref:cyclic pyranopterin monophosphate synthase MoaC n=1 Tax=Cellvibrio sp. OA-2007 TaxID=529823 RepID=UPI0007822A0A|nr:cyclic pyranopterin monophosphate synthase MoaC [Cellvibrio sp. OA-2007]